MNRTTREETSPPLGVIGCLRVGFEMVGRHLGLITFPVLLDLFLWLGPRVSVAPLVEGLVTLLMIQPAPDPTAARQVAQAVQLLNEFGEQFNLLSLFSTLPLLNVPSLLAYRTPGTLSPLGEPYRLLVTGVLALTGWLIVLVPLGLLLGFLYLNGVAHRVRVIRSPDGQGAAPSNVLSLSKGAAEGSGVEGPALSEVKGPVPSAVEGSRVEGTELAIGTGSGTRKFVRIFLFATGLLATGAVLAPLWMLLLVAILTVSPMLGLLVWAFSLGLGSYIVLHLLFVVPGVVLGGRGLWQATWESIVLMHTHFPSVVGLVMLAAVIQGGLSYVWSLPSADSWSLLVGILGNGCIATGLTAATFVFYQERIGQLAGMLRISARGLVE